MTKRKYLQEAWKSAWPNASAKTRATAFYVANSVFMLAALGIAISLPAGWIVAVSILILLLAYHLGFAAPYKMVDRRERIIKQHAKVEDTVTKEQAAIDALAEIHGIGRELASWRYPAGDFRAAHSEFVAKYQKWVASVHSALTPHEKSLFDHVFVEFEVRPDMSAQMKVWRAAITNSPRNSPPWRIFAPSGKMRSNGCALVC